MTAWEITNAIALLVLPPGTLILLAAWGLARAARRRRFGLALAGGALAGLYVLSAGHVADALIRTLEPPPLDARLAARGQAIVILGGGKYANAPEYGADTVNAQSLFRLRYGAALHRSTGKPVLVTGGSPEGGRTAEATAMKHALENDFKVAVTWTETRSRNTLENARLSWLLLEPAGMRTVLLVTDAWHMPRARLAFERAGFTVIPAATGYATARPLSVTAFLPGAQGLRDSSRYFHEVIGLAWYRIQFALGR